MKKGLIIFSLLALVGCGQNNRYKKMSVIKVETVRNEKKMEFNNRHFQEILRLESMGQEIRRF